MKRCEVPLAAGTAHDVEAWAAKNKSREMESPLPERAERDAGPQRFHPGEGFNSKARVFLHHDVVNRESGPVEECHMDGAEADRPAESFRQCRGNTLAPEIERQQGKGQTEQEENSRGPNDSPSP